FSFNRLTKNTTHYGFSADIAHCWSSVEKCLSSSQQFHDNDPDDKEASERLAGVGVGRVLMISEKTPEGHRAGNAITG
ncbi:hypothetical protein MJH76_23635, partial [Salmonella enterica subsp. enterica serovar Montevideo]|nr:hypothetical protein [Salmonella enterica subsp. enterica serovar Montevideo]